MVLAWARYCLALSRGPTTDSQDFEAVPDFNASTALFQIKHMQRSQHATEANSLEELPVAAARERNASLLEVTPLAVAREYNLMVAFLLVGCIVALIILVSICLRRDGKASKQKKRTNKKDAPGFKMVLNRFNMMTSDWGIVGEGSFSTCRKAIDKETCKQVAIKIYKAKSDEPGELEICLQKFKRQIEVLQDLGKALEKNMVPDIGLWSTALESVQVTDIFTQLIDYSKDSSGQPGKDPNDGEFYVVTELADYSLRDFLTQCRVQGKAPERDEIQHITRSIITVVAVLHAKGLVHMDIKPENLIAVGGVWKLIDIDGCMKIGSEHSLRDDEFAFTPLMCAPELASCLVGDQGIIKITSALDVWSVGVTIAELVSLENVFQAKHMSFVDCSKRDVEADFRYMDWLSKCEVLPLPPKVEAFDSDILRLLLERLLVRDASKRSNLAQCIDDPIFDSASVEGTDGDAHKRSPRSLKMVVKTVLKLRALQSSADSSAPPGICHGMLWKLTPDGDIKNPEDWVMRAMWVGKKGHLFYFSIKENKRVVYMDRVRLMSAKIRALGREDQAARNFAFHIQVSDEKGELEPMYFAAENETEQKTWMDTLTNASNKKEWQWGQKVAVNSCFVEELRLCSEALQRTETTKSVSMPPVKALIWKLKEDGDQQQADHWFQGEMWVSRSGSLCYYSKTDDKEFIYYNHEDLEHCTIEELPPGSAALCNAFEVKLKQVDGCDFDPGVFAADTPNLTRQFMTELKKLSVVYTDV